MKLLWGPVGTHKGSFQCCRPRPPTASCSQDWGFATPTQKPKTTIAIISGTGEASNLANTIIGFIRIKSPFNFGEKGAWAYPGAAQIFGSGLV